MSDIERSALSQQSRKRLAGDIDYYAGGPGVATYDLLLGQGGMVLEGDIAFYLDCASRHGDPVLELGTGTGRVLWPLAEAGHRVTGIDLSQPMLEAAIQKGEQYPNAVRDRVRLVHMDMTVLDLEQRYALALVPARAFQHLTSPEDQRRCLQSIHRHLTDDGHLVIDLFDPLLDHCTPGGPSPSGNRELKDPKSGLTHRRTVVDRICDPVRQTVEERLLFEIFDEAGTVVEKHETRWALRWVLRQEMRYLFELCGFEIVDEFSDFSGAPPAYGKEQIWVARRV